MWMKRNATEILFSTEYTRYQLNEFKSDTLNYLVDLYKHL